MTAAMTGALSTRQAARLWSTIDWDRVQKHVYRLQVRIAKAIALGKYHKAQALQWLLVRSQRTLFACLAEIAGQYLKKGGSVFIHPLCAYQSCNTCHQARFWSLVDFL